MDKLDNHSTGFNCETQLTQIQNETICRGHKSMSHDDFVKKMAQLQPNLIVVSNYVNKKTKVRCKCRICGFEWEALPQGFYKSAGCLRCNGYYRRTREEFIEELAKINPMVEVLGTYQNVSTKLECKCRICGYKWMARPAALLQGNSCMKCQHTKLRKTHDVFVDEISSISSNILIVGEYAGNDHTIRCKCKNCGCEWDGSPRSLRRGAGCPDCRHSRQKAIDSNIVKSVGTKIAKRNKKSHEQFRKEAAIANSKVTIIGEYVRMNQKIDCQCNRCGHIWSMLPCNIMKGRGCPECSKNQTSCFERYILFALQKALGENNVLSRDKSAISKELDIYIPILSVAIEPGRWYWHKRKFDKDQEKYNLCAKQGIKLITIYDEFDADRNQLKLDDNWITYPYKLGENDKKEELVLCVKEIFNRLKLSYEFSKNEEAELFIMAKMSTSRKSTDMIIAELKQINDNIELLSNYQGSKSKMKCMCKKCGHIFESNYDHLIRRKQGCPKCNSHKKAVVNLDTGEIFDSATAAANNFGMSNNSIAIVCRGINQTCAGYHWSYIANLTDSQLTALRTQFPDTFKY